MAKKTSKDTPPVEDELPFEDLLGRLESLVGTLEEGSISLEDSLRAYEEGVTLVRRAQGRLDAMDASLEELLQDGSTTAFELDSGDEDAS